MNALRHHKRLLWLLAGWLFIAPLLGFQHLYGAHGYIADDVCETCVLSSGGGHAITPQITVAPVLALHFLRVAAIELPAREATRLRANARAPPIA